MLLVSAFSAPLHPGQDQQGLFNGGFRHSVHNVRQELRLVLSMSRRELLGTFLDPSCRPPARSRGFLDLDIGGFLPRPHSAFPPPVGVGSPEFGLLRLSFAGPGLATRGSALRFHQQVQPVRPGVGDDRVAVLTCPNRPSISCSRIILRNRVNWLTTPTSNHAEHLSEHIAKNRSRSPVRPEPRLDVNPPRIPVASGRPRIASLGQRHLSYSDWPSFKPVRGARPS